MAAPSLKIWGNSIGAFAAYGSTDGGTTLVPLKLNADGELVVNLEAATVNIGDVDVLSLPSGNLGAQAKAASLCVNPASDISDATYIGDIKFGEALPAGTNLIGKVGIDQVTANANEVVVKSRIAETYLGKDRTTTTGAAEELTIPANGKRVILSCAPSSQAYIELNADASTSSPLYFEDPFGPLVLDLGSVTKLSAWVVAGNVGAVFFG